MSDLTDPVDDGQAECQKCGEWYRVTAPYSGHVCEHALVEAVFTFKAILMTEPLTSEQMLEKLRERLAYAGYRIVRE